jgi:predicted transcriptional regulator
MTLTETITIQPSGSIINIAQENIRITTVLTNALENLNNLDSEIKNEIINKMNEQLNDINSEDYELLKHINNNATVLYEIIPNLTEKQKIKLLNNFTHALTIAGYSNKTLIHIISKMGNDIEKCNAKYDTLLDSYDKLHEFISKTSKENKIKANELKESLNKSISIVTKKIDSEKENIDKIRSNIKLYIR